MKCTECSLKVKPVVVCDIDGTLGEYHEHFSSFALMYHNRVQIIGRWDGSGEFEDYLCLTKAEYREAKLAYRQGGGKRLMPLYPEAREFIMAVIDSCELWLATTRPWMRHDSTDPDTRHWLEKYRLPYHHLLYDENKYQRLSELVDPDRVVLLVEDLPDQFDLAGKYFPDKAVMIRRAHNRAGRRDPNYGGLLAVAKEAQIRIKNWEERYGG